MRLLFAKWALPFSMRGRLIRNSGDSPVWGPGQEVGGRPL